MIGLVQLCKVKLLAIEREEEFDDVDQAGV
jgi:hypothetical protein